MFSETRSTVRKCGRINSKSSAASAAKNPLGERGTESKRTSFLKEVQPVSGAARRLCVVADVEDQPYRHRWQEKMAIRPPGSCRYARYRGSEWRAGQTGTFSR